MRELLIGLERIGHAEDIGVFHRRVLLFRARLRNNDAPGALLCGLGGEVLAVKTFTLERDEEHARLDLARIRHHIGKGGNGWRSFRRLRLRGDKHVAYTE